VLHETSRWCEFAVIADVINHDRVCRLQSTSWSRPQVNAEGGLAYDTFAPSNALDEQHVAFIGPVAEYLAVAHFKSK
jgi:hypothetical protein